MIEHHDRRLIDRLLGGDEAAFEMFVDEYYPRLYRFAYRRLRGDADAAQDVVQGTFERVIPSLAGYRGEAALFSWLCTFCRHEIASFLKKRHPIASEVELTEEAPEVRAALESLATAAEGPENELQRKELARIVRLALDHLPLHYDHALEWKYLRGMPVKEIAERLALTPKAAESLLTRARQAFRDAFAELAGRTLS